MKRRAFVVGGVAAVAVPLSAEANRATKVHRIGVLWHGSRDARFEPFIQALADLGYVEGRNLLVEFRTISVPELSAQAADLIRLNFDVVVTQATRATQAAMDHTRTIPIVMIGAADPVATGIVASLHHPGGNVTGSTDMRPALTPKRVQLLKEIGKHRGAIQSHRAGRYAGVGGHRDCGACARTRRAGRALCPVLCPRASKCSSFGMLLIRDAPHSGCSSFGTIRANVVGAIDASNVVKS
jgi:hypothetical protein